jgi:hypothetical protein
MKSQKVTIYIRLKLVTWTNIFLTLLLSRSKLLKELQFLSMRKFARDCASVFRFKQTMQISSSTRRFQNIGTRDAPSEALADQLQPSPTPIELVTIHLLLLFIGHRFGRIGEFQLAQIRSFCFSWSSRNHLGNRGKCRIRGQKATFPPGAPGITSLFAQVRLAKFLGFNRGCVMRCSPLARGWRINGK